MRVAAVQFKATKGDVPTSRTALAALAGRAADGAELVVLPEMAATGYLFVDAAAVRAVAEEPQGPTFQALAPIARARRCHVVCGFAERARDRLFNSALVIDPSGALAGVYRKTLLYEADLPWATPGDSGYAVFDGGRFGVGICMDLNDDRFVDWVYGARVPIVAFPTNWVEQGSNVWWYWSSRLCGVRTSLVAANTWGVERAGASVVEFTGESAVLVDGVVVAAGPHVGDQVVTATVP